MTMPCGRAGKPPDRGRFAFDGPGLVAIIGLAKKLALTTYDAAYIELAQRRSLPLATLDGRLRQACAAMNLLALP